jgi:isoleucyl-tRNA synthetase
MHTPEHWEQWYPASFITEMREQIRLWFYSMLFMSVALEDRAPYQRVLTYEKLLDEHGNPMHKSLGNAIWFDEAAEKMGADVMRWLYAGQNVQSNLLFGYGPAEETRRKLLTLWNTYRFYVEKAELEEFAPASSQFSAPSNGLPRMDRWIRSELDGLVALANERLDDYDLAAVADAVDSFVDDLSNWYLRRGRRRFSSAAEPADRRAAFETFHACLVTLARIIASRSLNTATSFSALQPVPRATARIFASRSATARAASGIERTNAAGTTTAPCRSAWIRSPDFTRMPHTCTSVPKAMGLA